MDAYDKPDKGAWFMFKSSFDIKTDWWYLTLAVWINQKNKNKNESTLKNPFKTTDPQETVRDFSCGTSIWPPEGGKLASSFELSSSSIFLIIEYVKSTHFKI